MGGRVSRGWGTGIGVAAKWTGGWFGCGVADCGTRIADCGLRIAEASTETAAMHSPTKTRKHEHHETQEGFFFVYFVISCLSWFVMAASWLLQFEDPPARGTPPLAARRSPAP